MRLFDSNELNRVLASILGLRLDSRLDSSRYSEDENVLILGKTAQSSPPPPTAADATVLLLLCNTLFRVRPLFGDRTMMFSANQGVRKNPLDLALFFCQHLLIPVGFIRLTSAVYNLITLIL